MKSNVRNKFGRQMLMLHLLVAGALAMAACQPIVDTRADATLPAAAVESPLEDAAPTEADESEADASEAEEAETAEAESAEAESTEEAAVNDTVEAEILLDPAVATITTRSLRVREAPDSDSEVVAGAREGESYPVIAISADGAWVQIEIERSETGEGWVSTNFISLAGDITETETAPVASPSASGPASAPFADDFGPTATVDTRSLVVRAEPEEGAEVIAGLNLGDSFNVLGISPDGIWLLLELTEIEEEAGWVQANFVRLAGDLAAIPTIGEEPAEEAVAEVEEEATDEMVEEVTEEMTEEVAEEAGEEVAEATDSDATDSDATDSDATDSDEEAVTEEATEETAAEEVAEVLETAFTTATVNTRSLFVREAPTAASDPVAGAREGESYPVLGISEDGGWVLIQTARSETGQGWVSADFVILE